MKILFLFIVLFWGGTGAYAQEKENNSAVAESDTVEVEWTPVNMHFDMDMFHEDFAVCAQNESEYRSIPFRAGHFKVPKFDFSKNLLLAYLENSNPDSLSTRLYYVKSANEYVWEINQYYWKYEKTLEHRPYLGFFAVPITVECAKLKKINNPEIIIKKP